VRRDYEAPQGETEQAIAGVWQELLHVERVGRHDNFFDLGGHSLLAMAFVNRLHGLEIDLPIAALFWYPTLSRLAEYAESKFDASLSDSHLVPLRAEGNSAPLFLIHETTGAVTAYISLSQLLNEDVPVYGLQATDATEVASLENLATQHLQAIRRMQPQGPYRLAGWSLGGILAYEIARQLLVAGESVEFVGMIDSYCPTLLDADSLTKSEVETLLIYVRWHMSHVDGQMSPVGEEKLRDLANQNDIAHVFEQCRQSGFLPSEITIEAMQRLLKTMHHLARLALQYRPKPSRLSVQLYISGEHEENQSRGWESIMGDQLRVRRIGGTHDSIIQQPYLQSLVDAMNQNLEQPQRADARNHMRATQSPRFKS
jgi:thioesterase domain-containing protein